MYDKIHYKKKKIKRKGKKKKKESNLARNQKLQIIIRIIVIKTKIVLPCIFY